MRTPKVAKGDGSTTKFQNAYEHEVSRSDSSTVLDVPLEWHEGL